MRLTRQGDTVLLLGGRGHNGDDVRAATRHVAAREVVEIRVEDPGPALGELCAALERRPALVVDGLFGIGLNRPLSGDWIRFIETLNASGLPVLAVDVPSGLDADSGRPWGTAVCALETLTVGAPKSGLLAPGAASWTGRVRVAGDVGLCPVSDLAWDPAPDLWWTEPADFGGLPPRRGLETHKGAFGHVVVVAGSHGYHGAAVLAARGAMAAGAGLVTVVTDPATYLPVAGHLVAPMVHAFREGWEIPVRTTAVVMGPGLAGVGEGSPLKRQCLDWWTTLDVPVVADASALAWLKGRSGPRGSSRIVTPHPGEAGAVLGLGAADVQADRLAAVRRLAGVFGGALVVLKGHLTLVGGESGPVTVNPTGNPGLAQGGTGDVLAGCLGGLLAQPGLRSDPARIVRLGVWAHGAAADELAGGRAWSAEDLPAALGGVLARRCDGDGGPPAVSHSDLATAPDLR